MKYDKFFSLAKAAGIEEAELYIATSYALEFSLFHGEVDNYSLNNGTSIVARGLINGKFGAASCDSWSKGKPEYLVEEIIKNAKIIENNDPRFIFEGSPKYKKVHVFNKELPLIPIEEKMSKLRELEEALRGFDPRIVEVQGTEYSEHMSSVTLINSKGLKLTQKSNYFVYVAAALASDGKQMKSGWEIFLDNDFSKFDPKDLAKKIAEGTLSQLGGEPCNSKTYKAVLSNDVMSSLLQEYISSASAEEIQKQSSFFIGKLNQKVASKCVTVEDRPLAKNVFARSFDDEGVATYNKTIIKNGVLTTFLHNLTTAAKDGVQSTGNGYRAGGSIGVAPSFLVLKPGKKSLDELFASVGNGVYITDVSGLHAGLDSQSGNFSLQSTGFLIENGKKGKGLDMVTISGNLKDLFNNISLVGSDVKVSVSGTSTPSVVIKKLAVAGK